MLKLPASGRHQAILHHINEGRAMSVASMADAFGVSTETVRRDLQFLEKDGKLKRVFGGALPTDTVLPFAPLEERSSSGRLGKAEIARLVSQLIQPNSWIFLTGGSTVLAIAEAMRDGPAVSVMTNMPAIGDALAAGQRHKVILTGGTYSAANRTLTGSEVLSAIDGCSFDLAVVGVYGFDPDYGIVDRSRHNTQLKTRLVQQSREKVFVADHRKFAMTGGYRSVPFADLGCLATDIPPPSAFAKSLTDAGVDTIVAQDTPQPEIETRCDT